MGQAPSVRHGSVWRGGTGAGGEQMKDLDQKHWLSISLHRYTAWHTGDSPTLLLGPPNLTRDPVQLPTFGNAGRKVW